MRSAPFFRALGARSLWLAFAFTVTMADARDEAPGDISFRRDIAPVLVERCLSCHGPEKSSGGYRLDTFSGLKTPGRREEAPIVPGAPADSLLYRLITHESEGRRMPKRAERLPDEAIAAIRRWIEGGAAFDGPDENGPLLELRAVTHHAYPPEPYPRPVPVTALAFDPEGKELAASGYHEVTVWDPREGQLLRRIANVDERVYAIDYHPEGSLIAVASGAPGRRGEASIFDPRACRLLRRLVVEPDAVLDVAFSPRGDRLAAATASGAVRVIDVLSGNEVRSIRNHADWVMSVSWSTDGARIVSASRDKSVKVFDTAGGGLLSTYSGHRDVVFAAAFDARGRVWSCGRDRRLRVWMPDESDKATEVGGYGGEVHGVVVSGGRVFTCSADGTAREHEIENRREVRAYRGHDDWLYALDFSPAEEILATGGFDGEIRIWSAAGGGLINAFPAVPPPRETREF